MQYISNDIEKILDDASSLVLSKGRTTIDTPALFISSISFLEINKKDNRKLYKALFKVLRKYNITKDNFNKAYDNLIPTNDKLEEQDTMLADEVSKLLNDLKDYALNNDIVSSLAELFTNLFNDRTYLLHQVFELLSIALRDECPVNGFDVKEFYEDILKALTEFTVRRIDDLESDKLKQALTNINSYVRTHESLRFIGMDSEFTSLLVALSGRTKRSAVLVGRAGTGKTTLVHKLAYAINQGDEKLPQSIKGKVIYELHLDALVAGTQFRGQFEQKFLNILDTVAKNKDVILFIDEIHTITRSGGNEGDLTAANIIKPYLSRGDIQVIGATTDDEFNEYIEKDKAISRRFIKVLVEEPTKDEVLEILKGTLEENEHFFAKEMKEELIEKIYNLSNQYNLHTANPDKSLTMLESAFAYSKVMREQDIEVSVDDIINSVRLQFNINMSNNKVNDTKKALEEEILGQEEALKDISNFLEMVEYNIVDPNKPKCNLLFAGPSGCGKTFSSKIIAEKFMGSDRNLILVEGSQLQSETSVNVLFGSDPGYVGFKQTSDFLAKVKQNPNCVVLFDEIEKAHDNVFKSLLNILDEGFATDKGGNKVSFRNAIIIFTTNLGYGINNKKGTTFMSGGKGETQNAIDEINKHFSPEFLGRLDKIVSFNRLSDEVSDKLIKRYSDKYRKLSGFDVIFNEEDIKDIKEKSDIYSFGARNIDHEVKLAFLRKVKENK